MLADDLGACVALGKRGFEVEDGFLRDGGRSRTSQAGGDGGADEKTGWVGVQTERENWIKLWTPLMCYFSKLRMPRLKFTVHTLDDLGVSIVSSEFDAERSQKSTTWGESLTSDTGTLHPKY